jgi:hypothetical protein
MSLKNSRKALKSILAGSVIFASLAVTIGAGCVWVLKNVSARRLFKNKCVPHKDVWIKFAGTQH